MFFLYCLLFLCFIIILFLYSTIEISFININYSSYKIKQRNLNSDYRVILKIKLLNILPIIKINITKNKLEKKTIRENLSKLKIKLTKDKGNFDIKVLSLLKNIKLELKNIKLNIQIGLEDAAQTAILTGSISSLISLILHKYMKNKSDNYWAIIPCYQNTNFLNISFDGTISLKIKHIINVVYDFKKREEQFT